MGYIKISENLFLEKAEYQRLQKFFDEDGLKRHALINTDSYGLVRQAVLPQIGGIELADSFYVAKAGTPFNEVIIGAGIAVNSDANLIINKEAQNLQIPNDGLWYWIRINHRYDVEEKGVVSVDNLGNLTGVGTEFTKILRGQPNFPSKIRFLNSTSGNAQTYEVVRVIDDTSAILAGDFINERDLKFGVYGTFTPGYPVPTDNEMIFQYDSVEIELIAETTLGQAPNHLINKEFYIARVRNNGIDVTLQDKRIQWWETEAMKYLRSINRGLPNPLIGVEAVKYDISTSTRAKNIVELAWGFRTSNYTIDTSSKKISILIGNGGVYKDTSFFQSGDFNGWRLYTKNGSWRTIIDSQKTGTQIVITLDVLDPIDYLFSSGGGSNNQLFIAPPYEGIEFRFRRDGAIMDVDDQDRDTNVTEVFPWPTLEKIFAFNINTPLAELNIPALDGCYNYNVTFRYKVYNEYTDWLKLPDDTTGHYDEGSFDKFGNLHPNVLDRNQVPYAGHLSHGFIKVCEHEKSFNNWRKHIDTGELYGVNTTRFVNSAPNINLEAGVSKRYQHFTGNEITLGANIYIHLKRKDVNGNFFKEGDTFFIHIDQWINLSTFKLRIVEDFINPTNFTELVNIDLNDVMYIRNNTINDTNQSKRRGLFIRCTYNEFNHWIIRYESETTPKGAVRMVKDITTDTFNVDGYGQKQGYWGWKIISEMNGIFPVGTNNVSQSGNVEGQNSIVLNVSNLPRHSHSFNGQTGTTDGNKKDGGHVHSVKGGGTSGRQRGFEFGNMSAGKEFYPADDNLEISKHRHQFHGETASVGSFRPIDIRPRRMKFVFIEKIV